jgi:hypothetical protein
LSKLGFELPALQGTMIEEKPKGRPTLYKLESCELLIELMAKGHSFTAAMAVIGVSNRLQLGQAA